MDETQLSPSWMQLPGPASLFSVTSQGHLSALPYKAQEVRPTEPPFGAGTLPE